MPEVTVYGTLWSVASWDIRRLLERIGIPHVFVDLDADAEANAWVQAQGGRVPALPVVRLSNGIILVGPTRAQVASLYGVRLDTGLLGAPSGPLSGVKLPSVSNP